MTAANWFFTSAAVYLLGAMVLTGAINVPMNEDLADLVVPDSVDEARGIWDDYSRRWQRFNVARTVFSGVSLVAAAMGLGALSRREERGGHAAGREGAPA